jgi:membrane protease subunit (stomatin/prohibitin family)
VRPGQLAIFTAEGRIADAMHAGRYTWTRETLPALSSLRTWPRVPDSAFESDIYFVSMRPVTDLRWRTPRPIVLRDASSAPRPHPNRTHRRAHERLRA